MAAQVTNYQCPSCTGPLHFVGASGKLECDYCGSTYDVAEIEAFYAEKEEKAAAAQQSAEEKTAAERQAAEEGGWEMPDLSADWGAEGDGMKAYSCPSCGAELICDASTAATFCPYCGNPTVVPGQFAGTLKPDFVIPFKLSREDAIRELKKHYRGKVFLPKSFSKENHLQEIQGVYVPFWLFSGEAEGNAHYECTRSHKRTEGEYEVIKTEHFDVYRAGTMPFEKVPVDASTKMPDDHMDSIEPYNYDDLKPFSTAYLPGFLADKFDVLGGQEPGTRADVRCSGQLEKGAQGTVTGYATCFPEGRTRRHPAGQGPLRAAAGVAAEYQMAGQGFPLRHEWTDRKAGRRPACGQGAILGDVCRHCRAAVRIEFGHRPADAIRRDGHEKKSHSFADGAPANADSVRPHSGVDGIRRDLR